jgi:hypothetical protein
MDAAAKIRVVSSEPPEGGGTFELDKETVFPVATLRAIREWISASRERERFVVSSILMGFLSIFLVIRTAEAPLKNQRVPAG